MHANKTQSRLFVQKVVKNLQANIICDIGSLDGRAAKRFRLILPKARIVAFEGNPELVKRMKHDEDIKKNRIEIHHQIVFNKDGRHTFYVEETGGKKVKSGISSTRLRKAGSLGSEKITVNSIRLDSFIKENSTLTKSALWIDVEGAAYEVKE